MKHLNPSSLLLIAVAVMVFGAHHTTAPPLGYSAVWMVQLLSPHPIVPGTDPLSGGLVRLLNGLFPSSVSLVAGLANVLAAMLTLGLTGRIIHRLPYAGYSPEARQRTLNLAAMAAIAFLASTPPFLSAAIQPGPDMIDVLVLVGVIFCLTPRTPPRTLTVGHDATTGFLLGIGFLESPWLVIISPLALIGLTALRLHRGNLVLRSMLPLFTAALGAGLGAILLIFSWIAAHPDDGGLRLDTLADLARTWKAQTLAQAFPPGWLLILFVSVAFLLLSLNGALRLRKRLRTRTMMIQGLLGPGILATAWTLSLAPATSFTHVHLLAAFLLAVAFASVIAFWAGLWLRASDNNPLLHRVLAMGIAGVMAVGFLPCLPDLRNQPRNAWRPLWDALLYNLHDDTWILSDGLVDAPLWIAAHQAGIHPLFLDARYDGLRPYRETIALSLSDPRDQSLARIGASALIAERLRTIPLPPAALVSLGNIQPFLLARHHPLPFLARYDAKPPETIPDHLDLLFVQHTTFWRQITPRLTALTNRTDHHGRLARALRPRLSRIANDLGVYFEVHQRPDLALSAYTQAITLNTNNLSAMINRQSSTPSLDVLLGGTCAPGILANLAAVHGAIADREIIEAIAAQCETPPFDPTAHAALQAAWQAHQNGERETSTRIVREALLDAPHPSTAFLLHLFLAEDALARRTFDEAYPHFEQAHRIAPYHPQPLEGLVKLDLTFEKSASLEQRLRRLLAIDPWNPWGNFALGLRHLLEEESEPAERAFLRALGGESLPLAANNLAWLLLEQNRLSEALFHVRFAISADPYGSAQWNTLAAILSKLGEREAAGVALHTALNLDPDNPILIERFKEWTTIPVHPSDE